VGTAILLGLVNLVFGLRVDGEDEELGLDLSQHSESGYTLTPTSALGEFATARADTARELELPDTP
jgi:hypothetical protein